MAFMLRLGKVIISGTATLPSFFQIVFLFLLSRINKQMIITFLLGLGMNREGGGRGGGGGDTGGVH